MSVSVTMPQLGESVTEGTVTRWLKKEGEHVAADEPLLEVSTDKVDTEIPSPASGILRGIVVDEDETVEVGAQLAVIEDEASAGTDAPAAAPAAPEAAAPVTPAPAPPAPPAYAPPAPAAPSYAPPPAASAPGYAPPASPPPAAAPSYAPPAPAQQPNGTQAAPATEPEPTGAYPEPTPLPTGGESPYVTPLVRKLATEHSVSLDQITGTGVGGRIRKQDVLDAARKQREAEAAAAKAAEAAQ
ncbi:MAG TPA: biotin/lipoyl-containing protein, partial [Streptosporangiaceae bacterium]